MIRRTLVWVAFLATALPLFAGEPADPVDPLQAFLETGDPVTRLDRGMRLVRSGAEPDAVAEALPGAWSFPADAVTSEAVSWTRTTAAGVEHTIYAYAPAAYTPEKAWPVLLWLHGGVSRPMDGGGESGVRMFAEEAETRGFLVLAPSGQEGSTWWTPTGVAMIRSALQDLGRRYRVDADRVAAMGMSDGASGCLHLLAHDPEPFCAFFAFVGNPIVTRIFGGPAWSANVSSRPVYAISGANDRLYPAAEIKPFFDDLAEAGCDLTWFEETEAGHDLSYLDARWEEVMAFWEAHPRDPLPTTIAWATSRPDGEGRYGWIEIVALDPDAPAADGLSAPSELRVPQQPPRPRLGIRLDTDFPGPGVRIEEVEEETPAAEAGFQPGDVLVRAGETDLANAEDLPRLREYLDGLGDEDGTFVLLRGEERLELRTRPKVLERDLPARPTSLGYDVAPGTLRASVDTKTNVIEVESQGVATFRLHLAAPLIDFERELVVRVNGREAFRGSPPRDLEYLLAQAIRQGAGGPVYRGSLLLETGDA